MIDGFKISLPNFDPSVWSNHTGGHLAFVTTVDEQGEVLKTSAFHRALNFRAMPSKKENQKHHATVSGSLHRFHNGGGTNDNDFTHAQLIATIDELATVYQVEPSTAKIENFEFGVNISLPFPCQTLFDKIVSMPSKRFNEMTLDAKGSKAYGKRCDRGEYEIKIYDKALQSNINAANGSKTGAMSDGLPSNILRVEVAVKKMRYVKASGIKVLADFKDSQKIAVLRDNLLSLLSDIIFNEVGFSDAAFDNLRLNQRQERQLSRWINPIFWEQMDWKQRKNERSNYDKFVTTILPPQYQTGKILTLHVAEKWNELATNQTAQSNPNYNFQKVIVIVTDSELDSLLTQSDTNTPQTGRFSPLCNGHNIDGQNGVPFDATKVGFHRLLKGENLQNNNNQNKPENPKNDKRQKSVKTVRACPCCKADVSEKRPNAVFCSKRCKRKATNAKRDRRKTKPPTPPKATTTPQTFATVPRPQYPPVPMPQTVTDLLKNLGSKMTHWR